MKFLLFDTQNEALEAEKVIAAALGYPKFGINAASGEPATFETVRYAVPMQFTTGKWGFKSPDDSGVEAQNSWFDEDL